MRAIIIVLSVAMLASFFIGAIGCILRDCKNHRVSVIGAYLSYGGLVVMIILSLIIAVFNLVCPVDVI